MKQNIGQIRSGTSREERGSSPKNLIRGREIPLILGGGFVCAIALLLIFVPNFFEAHNILQLLRKISIPAIMAMGVTFVVICGRLDLSVGAILSASAVAAVEIFNATESTILVVLAPLLIGLAVGIVNGALVAFAKINSLITTLGMMSIVMGLSLLYTGGADMFAITSDSNFSFAAIGRGSLFGIPVPVVIAAVVAVISVYILHATTFGRMVFGTGGNYVASTYSAINVRVVIFLSYLISGVLASFAGIIYASRVMTARHDSGEGMELVVLSMVILGGTSLLGGSGSIARTLLGALIIGVVETALLMLGYPFYVQWICIALILIVAAWLNQLSQTKGMEQ